MREYLQEWENGNGNERMTTYYNYSTERYEIEGFINGRLLVLRFASIYDANKYMELNGWK